MKINKLTILLISFFILISCNETKKRNNEIKKITLFTGLCYGTCPIQIIEVDSSLTIKYHGEKYAEREGYYKGKITETDWNTINEKFEKIKYKDLDTLYERSIDDPPTYIEIKYGNKVKKIRAQSASLPEEVEKTYYWLIDFCNKTELEKTTDTLVFETEDLIYMYPPPPPLPSVLKRNEK